MVAISKKNLIVPELDQEELKNEEIVENSAENANAESENESSEDEEDAKAIRAALEKNPRSKNRVNNRITPEQLAERGVVYIGHIPKGFCEPQVRQFFSQFGKVTRSRLARSIKSGKSKGYGFVEFELAEVAAVVAKTMNKYLLYGRTLVVNLMPKDSVHASLFKGCHKRIVNTCRLFRHKARTHHNKSKVIKAEDGSEVQAMSSRQLERRKSGANKKKQALALLGIDYEFTGNNSSTTEAKKEVVAEKKEAVVEKKAKNAKKAKAEEKKEAPKEEATVAPKEEKKKAVAKPQKTTAKAAEKKPTKKTAMKSKK